MEAGAQIRGVGPSPSIEAGACRSPSMEAGRGDLGRQRGRSPSLDIADVDHADREEAGAAIL